MRNDNRSALFALGCGAFVVGLLDGYNSDQGQSLRVAIHEMAPSSKSLRRSRMHFPGTDPVLITHGYRSPHAQNSEGIHHEHESNTFPTRNQLREIKAGPYRYEDEKWIKRKDERRSHTDDHKSQQPVAAAIPKASLDKSASPWEAPASKAAPAQPPSPASDGKEIAICLGFTTKARDQSRAKQAMYGLQAQSPMFKHLLPSLCETKSPGYRYSLWLAYDYDDPLLSIEVNATIQMFLSAPVGAPVQVGMPTVVSCRTLILQGMPELFRQALVDHVPGCDLSFHLLKMNYTGNPTWAQNDAAMAAHKAGADYFYRVNDDSVLASKRWTEHFIGALQRMNPPKVGVVGPMHSGGNVNILTYDFTSRKHIDIFGFHYPREFRSWWGDDWITQVYQPNNMMKLPEVRLEHKLEVKRYEVGENKKTLGILEKEVSFYRARLDKWIRSHPNG